MYKTTNEGLPTPNANLAINKSRIKLYGKTSKVPTYYLQNGQEFQIELFNPTTETIMAKISLNGKLIGQGGLVLKPAQRVFLDRYIDMPKRFKFETYEVANTSESIAAIEDNGDLKVEFYKELTPIDYNLSTGIIRTSGSWGARWDNNYFGNPFNTTANTNFNDISSKIGTLHNSEVTMDWTEQGLSMGYSNIVPKSNKKIETGRVEAGSKSDQTLNTVYMNWEYTPFHTIEYKMLPISQKINTVADVSVKRYCTNCANKLKPTFKYCPVCATRV